MTTPEKRQVAIKTALVGLAGIVFAWAYWPTLSGLTDTWRRDPNYSQGFLVPVIALVILIYHCHKEKLSGARLEPWGLAVLLAATAVRGAGAYFYLTSLDHLSLLLSITGLFVLFGGWPWLRLAWPAIIFLLFMIPLPQKLGGASLTAGLQSLATTASTWTLQTVGVTAEREGNVILLKNTELGVVQACSGLRMLMVFFALATAAAIFLPYGWKRRTILITSAIPLALLCNVVRITAAGVAAEAYGQQTGYYVFHDLSGWLMPPLAFALMGLEILLLAWLFRPESGHRGPVFLGMTPG